MKGILVPVVMVPRYTSFIGPGSYATPPQNVEPYSKLTVTFWRGLMPYSGTRTCTFYFEDSHDADAWRILSSGTADPGPDGTLCRQVTLTRRWLRVRIEVEGPAGTSVSCWAVGSMETRVDG
jgi:hypothetical protein